MVLTLYSEKECKGTSKVKNKNAIDLKQIETFSKLDMHTQIQMVVFYQKSGFDSCI